MVRRLLADEQVDGAVVTQHRQGGKEVAVTKAALRYILVRRAISKQHCAWHFTGALPASDLAHALLLEHELSKDLLFLLVRELVVGKLGAILGHSSDLGQLLGAIGHLFNRHVGVVSHHLESSLLGLAHLGEVGFTLSCLFGGSLLGHLLIDSLLALIIEEASLEGIKQSELIGGQLPNGGLRLSVAHLRRLRVGNLEVDTDEVKLGTVLLDELEEILAFLILQLSCVLQNDQLELNDCLELGQVGTAHVLISEV
mmetsp:Transcript_46363/g.61388  ORF Transcript_46363/g.61388 Transcript_46363/m.61388 type:complete len:255 (-) Transcript_46363:1421-2185(-)